MGKEQFMEYIDDRDFDYKKKPTVLTGIDFPHKNA